MLNISEKIKLVPLFIFSILSILLETLSIGILVPLFTTLFNTSEQVTNIFYFIDLNNLVTEYSNFFNINNLVIIIALIYIFKNLFLSYVIYWTNKYTIFISVRLSYELLKIYLMKPFVFHLKENSSNLIRNVSQEVSVIQVTILSVINIII